MAQSVPIHYHISDYELWEGDWELIEGIPVAMTPAPVLTHQRLAMLILMELEQALADCAQCNAYPEAEWRIGDDTVLRPDGVVICYPPGPYLDRPPALTLEVLSPSSVRIDREYKPERYAREGVTHYLIADPDTRTVEIYHLHDGHYDRTWSGNSGIHHFDLGPCQASIDLDRVFARL